MKARANFTSLYSRSIASLLLLIFCNLLAVGAMHSHVTPRSSQVKISASADDALVQELQVSCLICDYIHHGGNQIITDAVQFNLHPNELVLEKQVAKPQVSYTFDDRLLFSGTSPPQA